MVEIIRRGSTITQATCFVCAPTAVPYIAPAWEVKMLDWVNVQFIDQKHKYSVIRDVSKGRKALSCKVVWRPSFHRSKTTFDLIPPPSL